MSNEEWQTGEFRCSLVKKLDEAKGDWGNQMNKDAVEVEKQVFLQAKSNEEYPSFVDGLNLNVKNNAENLGDDPDMKQGQMRARMGGPGASELEQPKRCRYEHDANVTYINNNNRHEAIKEETVFVDVPGTAKEEVPLVVISSDEEEDRKEYLWECIVSDKRRSRFGKIEYYVKWVGGGRRCSSRLQGGTWQPKENLRGTADEAVQRFEEECRRIRMDKMAPHWRRMEEKKEKAREKAKKKEEEREEREARLRRRSHTDETEQDVDNKINCVLGRKLLKRLHQRKSVKKCHVVLKKYVSKTFSG